MDDENFLEAVIDLAEEGIMRCERWERKRTGRAACLKPDLLAVVEEAEQRLAYCQQGLQGSFVPAGARGGWKSLLEDLG